MIMCITPNPDIERTWIMDTVHMGDVNHVHQVTVAPSGKGVNVARAVHTLEGESFCAGFLGGLTGRYLESLILDLGIPAKWTWIKGETRTAITIIEISNPDRDATLISEAGPRVTTEDWERLQTDVSSIQADVACICGRLPGNSSVNPFIRII